jgi:hypothetical protein
MTSPNRGSVGMAAGALLASSATLVCCVLPAVMVSLGAGAALAGLVSAVPQLIWLSERKGLVFGVAGAFLLIAGVFLRYARRLPCPTEPVAARQCMRLRAISHWLYAFAAIAFVLGALFAFALPLMAA